MKLLASIYNCSWLAEVADQRELRAMTEQIRLQAYCIEPSLALSLSHDRGSTCGMGRLG